MVPPVHTGPGTLSLKRSHSIPASLGPHPSRQGLQTGLVLFPLGQDDPDLLAQ